MQNASINVDFSKVCGRIKPVHGVNSGPRTKVFTYNASKLFTDIGPRMKDRAGGYTRVVKLGFRQGDAADMVILELVDYKLDSGEETEKKETKKAKAPAEKKASAEKKATSEKKAPAKKATTAKSKAKTEAPAEESAEKASE